MINLRDCWEVISSRWVSRGLEIQGRNQVQCTLTEALTKHLMLTEHLPIEWALKKLHLTYLYRILMTRIMILKWTQMLCLLLLLEAQHLKIVCKSSSIDNPQDLEPIVSCKKALEKILKRMSTSKNRIWSTSGTPVLLLSIGIPG